MDNIIKCFLKPKSVAIIGSSTKTGPQSYNILEVIKNKGYTGKIYPVNPKAEEILGIKTYPTVLDIPDQVDLAVIATGRSAVLDLVSQCVRKPVKGIIIIAQGFADADDEGQKMQNGILDLISGTGIRVIGPNTLGVINNFDKFVSIFLEVPTKASPVGIICQSGPIIGAHADIFNGAGYGVDIGNSVDIGFNEILEFYGREERIEVINLHMEGIRGGHRFLALCENIVKKKPIIVYKTGRSTEGAKAAGSHSGSLAGDDQVYQTAFDQVGVIRAESFDELRDFNKTFLKYKHTAGNRVAIVTFTGGGGIALLDAMEGCGLVTARLSPKTLAEIRKVFPDWLKVSNPVDFWPSVMMYGYEKVVPAILQNILDDPGVDIMVCISVTHSMPEKDSPYLEKFLLDAALKHPEKPVALWGFGSARHQMAHHVEGEGPVAVYSSPERLARSLGVLCNYHLNTGKQEATSFNKNNPDRAAVLDNSRGVLTGVEALKIINLAGIPTVPGKLARDIKEAIEAGKSIGYPLTIKTVGSRIIHKTDIGGIRLDIRDQSGLENAYRSMMAEVNSKAPEAEVEGVLVQKHISRGIELLLGSKRDSEFGPVLVFGLGGIYTEILKDIALRLAPVDGRQALDMIRETKAYQILSGARGKEQADIDALVQAIVSLSDFILNHPQVTEIDINPLLATPEGVIALDGRVFVVG